MQNPTENLIPESQFAESLGRSLRSVKRWRQLRCGPAFIRIGKSIYYRPEAIARWLEAQEQEQPRAQGVRHG